nr:MAG TPA: hypothetical protein [Inoviridae sp.]
MCFNYSYFEIIVPLDDYVLYYTFYLIICQQKLYRANNFYNSIYNITIIRQFDKPKQVCS